MSPAGRARRIGRRVLPARVRRAAVALRTRRPDPPKARRPAERPGAATRRKSLLRSIERGEPLDQAAIGMVRSLVAAGDHDRALSVAESLRRDEETRTLGRVAAGVVAFKRGFRALAQEELADVPRATWARLAPAEYVRSGLLHDADRTLAEVRALVADDPPEVRAKSWYEILAAVYGFGASDLVEPLFAIFDRHVREDRPLWRSAELHRDWLRPWIAAAGDSPTAPPPPEGRRTFAVMDYGHPSASKASQNIGDHIQSIASLGHLVRHRGVRLHGRPELVGLLDRLGARTRPERRRHDVDADLEVITVHRDASTYEPIPEGTWVLSFGWYMHALFNVRHAFPLHRNLRPIFISFHCNKRELLTPDAVAYLKRYGPIGCRDWTTAYLLLSIGVPAFFSGCVTTTVDTVFPDLAALPPADAPVAYVDVPAADVPAGAVAYRHSQEVVRRRSFVANVEAGLDLLETYRSRHRRVVTSRLHCCLPVRSLGMEVDFRPKNRADIRFDGLIDIPDAAFDAMREGIDGKLEQVFRAILTRRPEAEVYGLWRELTAADVAAAEERRAHEPPLSRGSSETAARVGRAVAETVTHERPADRPPVHCAVVLPQGGGLSLSVLLASLLEHASRPLHVWVLAEPGTRAIERRLAARFPALGFSWIPLRGLAARLVLPDLLPDVERLVLLPLPAVATGDVAELAELDLKAHAMAAARTPSTTAISGFGVIHAAAERLQDRAAAAATLRRLAYARHAFDFDAFMTDVLVLDLARWRQDRLSAEALAVAEEFGLDDREALHVVAGPRRAEVPERWAAVPTRTAERAPGLIHWADGVNPWQEELTPERELWRRYAAGFRSDAVQP